MSQSFLNVSLLRNKMIELELKQWWVAEQIGVDRKTVSRWMQGQVKQIKYENAKRLATLLECDVSEIVVESKDEVFASAIEQKRAAEALVDSKLIERLGPVGEWDVIEKLLKATLIEDLSMATLGQIYNKLAVASWRQSLIEQAEGYALRAQDIAKKIGDKQIALSARTSLANIASWRGQLQVAIQIYQDCIGAEKFFQDSKDFGAALSNLGAIYWEAGDLNSALDWQKKALDLLRQVGSPMQVSISHCQLAFVYNELDRRQLAIHHAEESVEFAKKGDYQRGLHMGRLVIADVESRNGNCIEAISMAEQAISGFHAMRVKVDEAFNNVFWARVRRNCGYLERAREILQEALPLAEAYPIEKASVYYELAKIAEANGNGEQAKLHFESSRKIWQQCGAIHRLSV